MLRENRGNKKISYFLCVPEIDTYVCLKTEENRALSYKKTDKKAHILYLEIVLNLLFCFILSSLQYFCVHVTTKHVASAWNILCFETVFWSSASGLIQNICFSRCWHIPSIPPLIYIHTRLCKIVWVKNELFQQYNPSKYTWHMRYDFTVSAQKNQWKQKYTKLQKRPIIFITNSPSISSSHSHGSAWISMMMLQHIKTS